MEVLKGKTFYVPGATNLGIFVHDDEVYLIDTGTDKKSIRSIFEKFNGKRLIVLNTHFHADHCQNDYLAEKLGARILVPRKEYSFFVDGEMEGFYLYSARPAKCLRKSFFSIKPVSPDFLENESIPLKVIDLSGHSPGMVGFLTSDGILFSADVFFSSEILKKYGYPYHSDVGKALARMDEILKMNFEIVVPSHGKPLTDPEREINFNRNVIENHLNFLLENLKQPRSLEEVMKLLGERFEITISEGTYYLFRSYVSSLLEYLERLGNVVGILKEYRYLWKISMETSDKS